MGGAGHARARGHSTWLRPRRGDGERLGSGEARVQQNNSQGSILASGLGVYACARVLASQVCGMVMPCMRHRCSGTME
jgi:hypothetical protein